MASIVFTRINNTNLDVPIELRMCKVPNRLLPVSTNSVTRYDLEQATDLGFEEGDVWLLYPSNTTRFDINNRYYMDNGNYFKLDVEYGDGLYIADWFWGFNYFNISADTKLTQQKFGESFVSSNYRNLIMKKFFYTDGVGCYDITIQQLPEPTQKYPSGFSLQILKWSLYSLDINNIPYIQGVRDFFLGENLFEKDTNTLQGGYGNYDNSSDNILLPPLPLLSPLQCGLFTMYAPTTEQLKSFSDYLWSNNIFENLPKLFQDPMEAILNLSIIPVEFPLANPQNIIVGTLDTGVSSNVVTNQYYEIDFGVIDLTEFWGNALDYENTKIDIFLPFISNQVIDTKDVMGCKINLKYRIDLLTGTCCAFLIVERENTKSVLYQWNGNCSISIPLTAQNVSQKISTLIGVGTSVMGGAIAMTNPTTMAFGAMALGQVPALMTNQQTHIQKAGSFQMESSYLGIWTPYITITRPKQAFADGYQHFKAFPSNITAKISDISGYCEIESVHLENIPATTDELNEIEQILKSGVIV